MQEGMLFIILLAITVVTVAAMLMQMIFSLLERKKRALHQRLGAGRGQELETVYGPIASAADAQPEMLDQWSAFKSFNRKLKRAYPDLILARFMILVIGIAGMSFFAAYVMMQSSLAGLIAAAGASFIPFLIVNAKCRRRLRTMDDQLPEALDFLSRVLRAGHSLTTGLQMAADELPDPLAAEFSRCYDRHSVGTPLDEAMREMAERVGTSDFAFFVTAVLIQRQTGGDLAEVLTNIGSMVRARIRLQQHVKAITAEGRLVGYILVVLPVVFFCALYALNPTYARVLLVDREGTFLLGGALVLQMFGLISIRRIVSVKL
jgi:tight adherence protein B